MARRRGNLDLAGATLVSLQMGHGDVDGISAVLSCRDTRGERGSGKGSGTSMASGDEVKSQKPVGAE